jgi:hypothetical protein
MQRILFAATAAVVAGVGIGLALPAPAAAPDFTGWPPCEYEDSVNCRWDAGTSGNGVGDSFVSLALPDGRVALIYDNGRVRVVGSR